MRISTWLGVLLGMVLLAGCANQAPPQTRSLYIRLGGAPEITKVVDDFVIRASGDPKVNFVRQGTDKEWQPTAANVARLKKHLVQFISVVAGATDVKYEGRDMKTTHIGMQISDAEFDALADDLGASLDKFNVPKTEKDELISAVAGTKGVIVEKK